MKKSIYVIKNKINNKVYVGQAIDPQHRFIAHLSRAKTNADNSPIHDAIEALGKENFYYPIRKETPYHLSSEEVDNIQWLLLNRDFTIKAIAEYFQVSEGTIKHINAGRNYKNSALSYPLKTGRAKGEKEPVSTILAKRSTLTIDT